ncbi:MAG: hypothetical protein QM500_00175 [Methylococcales bacterium]
MNKYILALSFLLAATSNIANAAMIDNFTEESMSVSVGFPPLSGSASASSTTTISAFGGGRTISISKNGLLAASANVIAPPGIYAHSADALTSATSTIAWHSNTGIDLIEGRSTTNFALDILSIDQGNIDLILSVTDVLNNTGSYTLSGAGTGLQFIALSLFSSNINFLQIRDISLKIVGDVASDLTLNSISTVPTPSVLILLSMGLVAFGFNRRISV